MLWFPQLGKEGVIFININKNASNSLCRALQPYHGVGIGLRGLHKRKARNSEVVVMWRAPHKRMESAYRMLQPEADFSDWVLKVCDDHKGDKHLMPQVSFCQWEGHWYPHHVIKWDFEQFRRIFNCGPIPHENKSEPMRVTWTPDAVEAFDRAYNADIRIWRA